MHPVAQPQLGEHPPHVRLHIGAVAGLYPALRAARLSPTEALRTL